MVKSFGTKEDGESLANTKSLILFNEIKEAFGVDANICSKDKNAHKILHVYVNKIIAQMTIPLFQSLIHKLMEEDYNAVLMYSLSVIPVIQGCNIEAFDVLFQKLILGNSFRSVNNPLDAIKNDDVRLVLDLLQDSYSCLGITCSNVGAYKTDVVQACDDADGADYPMMVGYLPNTDVQEVCHPLVVYALFVCVLYFSWYDFHELCYKCSHACIMTYFDHVK